MCNKRVLLPGCPFCASMPCLSFFQMSSDVAMECVSARGRKVRSTNLCGGRRVCLAAGCGAPHVCIGRRVPTDVLDRSLAASFSALSACVLLDCWGVRRLFGRVMGDVIAGYRRGYARGIRMRRYRGYALRRFARRLVDILWDEV